MLIKSRGIETKTFRVPPFELHAGEMLAIRLPNDPGFYQTQMFIKNILCGDIKDRNVEIYDRLTFVDHFIEPKIRQLFYPITVGEYLKKNADSNSVYSTKIYEHHWIAPKTKVNTLAGSPRRLLNLYATLSKTKNIVFDVAGQDPQGIKETCKTVKQMVEEGGSAIFLDCFENMKNYCTKYMTLEWKRK